MMGVELQNGPTTECRSLSSNHYPSGRFPKASIGIMVQKAPQMGSGSRKEDVAALLVRERASLFQKKIVEEVRGIRITPTLTENQTEGKDKKAAAWVSARSVHHETPNTQTVNFYANQASVLQSKDRVHKKLDSVTYEKREEKSGNMETLEEVAFATMQEMHVPGKGRSGVEPDKVVKASSETLRMKLLEVLGTIPSQNKHIPSPPILEGNSKNLEKEQNKECQMGEVTKPKQNSDTIETDSECPNETMRRPVTRSLTRKKDLVNSLPKLLLEKNNGWKPLSSSSDSKQKFEEKNIFIFNEGEGKVEQPSFAVNGDFTFSNRRRNERKNVRVKPRRISFPRRSVSGKSLQTHAKEQALTPPENTIFQRTSMGGTRIPQVQEKDAHQSKTDPQENLSSTSIANTAESSDTREVDGSDSKMDTGSFIFFKNRPSAWKTSPMDDFYSPTFVVNITPSLPKSETTKEGYVSPVLSEKRVPVSQFYSSRKPLNSRACSSGSVAHSESSDGTRDFSEPPNRESPSVVEEKAPEKHFSPSQMEELDSESLGTDELINKGFRETEKSYLEASGPNKSPFALHHSKRFHSLEDINIRKHNPSSLFPFHTSGIEETIGSHEASDQHQENSLDRAVTQLAVVLERFKTKIKSRTSKKSSEILSSVGDSIRLQLQEVESQIQADVGKFTSLGKSKRKRLESTFQEQQTKLKAIHDKFRDEVNQHLLDCRNTLEELEAYQMELKGNTETQKVSHRRLLQQVEEAMEVQLTDADSNIAAIHKAARKKMNGLKHVLRVWLSDSTFS